MLGQIYPARFQEKFLHCGRQSLTDWVCEGLQKCQKITVVESSKKAEYAANGPGINTAHRALFGAEWRLAATSVGSAPAFS